MNKTEKLAELRSLQARVDAIRQELAISPPGKIIFLSPLVRGDDMVVVEPDGFGAATTSVVEGNYPIDYITRFEKRFRSEREAEAAAEALSFQRAAPEEIPGALA